jgi:protein involved in polysaccharide export with SLBB domain
MRPFRHLALAAAIGLLPFAAAWAQSPARTATADTEAASRADASAAYSLPDALGSTIGAGDAPMPGPARRPQDPVQGLAPTTPQGFDYRANVLSDVFGAQLFTGAFANAGATQFNPDYLVASGDSLQVRLWGAFEFDATLVVDPQGNIFLPHVGPVAVRGVRNQELQEVVAGAVRRVFRANVSSYASLAAAQPVRVFVGGYVYRPGLYSGTSMDSLLHFLDQAGGIDPNRGSFLNVQIKRGMQVRATVNLYDFLLEGRMPLTQLSNGDVIFAGPRQSMVKVSGLAESAKRFEFEKTAQPTVADLERLAKPNAEATHVRVVRNSGTTRNTEYYPLEQAASVRLQSGDELEFTADKKPGTITVRVEGEHMSPQEYVLPYGTRMGVLLQQVQLNENSEGQSIQLFRQSVKVRQKDLLNTSLHNLESALLTARSGSEGEATLRKAEAELTLQWIDRAKKVEPLGQVVISQAPAERDNLLLENGDVLRVPTRDGLVLISGEVLFPNAVAYQASLGLQDYVDRAGGYTQTADVTRLVVARRDGSFVQTEDRSRVSVHPGDQVLVLPKVDDKQRQFWKEMVQIIYQIAISARVAIGL